ncbi:hypothetical protein BaRGS_00034797 [Batillaria attramentaria]|uniref:Uncharacterized protein n=1 Tax=Batillaria attramentaria TaxID=370345 RepID=A0ABD0JGK4_9CAEN
MSWKCDEDAASPFQKIPDVHAQSACIRNESLLDGQTYEIIIRATDIMGNSKEDTVRVSIDHTGPSLSIEGLRGGFGRDGLYVLNNTDLSTMELMVHAADPHSGLKTLTWTLGTSDGFDDIGRGAAPVQRSDCTLQESCYCPVIGSCEHYTYSVNFTSLVGGNTNTGLHHREYYFVVNATNNAELRTTQHLDILIDESPPTAGVVFEGLSDDDHAEMDFTSSDLLHVRWHGFLDHESGILFYRVVLAERCLTQKEMETAVNKTDVENGNAVTLRFPNEGHYYVSVVAFNGAMLPSIVVCSDGITFDTTAPTLLNVSITHARRGQAIGCLNDDQPWLINANLTRTRLSNTGECLALCALTASVNIEHLPVVTNASLDDELSADFCQRLSLVTENDFIVLPSDYLRLSWTGRDEESDMEEYYVGMGRDRTTASAPDLLPFTPTHGHHSYSSRHSGLGHGAVFFIFLRALSKAGLHVQLALGPVIIDVTPPEVTQPLKAVVQDTFLLVTWNNDTFRDPEQPAGVDFEYTFRLVLLHTCRTMFSFLFYPVIGFQTSFVTPFLELPESALAQCRKLSVTGCARYPISALQAHDTETGRFFFFQLHVINAAGHVTSVNTSASRLPAHFPPSQAVVMDVVQLERPLNSAQHPRDITTVSAHALSYHSSTKMENNWTKTTAAPGHTSWAGTASYDISANSADLTTAVGSTSTETTRASVARADSLIPTQGSTEATETTPEYSSDVDTILQTDSICIAWAGFHHLEEVTVEVGIGTSPRIDDTFSYFAVDDAVSPVCLNPASFPFYTKLFSLVRATSSGGTTVASSDGFHLIPRHDSNNKLMVFNGNGCEKTDRIGSFVIAPNTTVKLNQTSSVPIHHGDMLFVKFTPFVQQVIFEEAILIETTLDGHQIITNSTEARVVIPSEIPLNTSVEILSCVKDSWLLPTSENYVTVTWEMTGPWTSFVKSLTVSVTDQTCLETSPKKEKYARLQCLLGERLTWSAETKLEFIGKTVYPGHTYTSTVTVCFDNACLQPSFSDPVTFEDSGRFVTFHLAEIHSQTSDILEVEFRASVNPPMNGTYPSCVFQWIISKDRGGSIPLLAWQVVQTENCSRFEVKDILHIQADKGSIYACVHPLFPWRAEGPTCHKLLRPSTHKADALNIIELSRSTLQAVDLDEFLSSQHLGSTLQYLFDLDLDFAKSDVTLAAVLTNGARRSVRWFLMTEKRTPADGNCASDPACMTTQSSDDGKVVFQSTVSKLQAGHMYYVCAIVPPLANQDIFEVYHVTESRVCGDGVVIDDTAPIKGTVVIHNTDTGYVADKGHLLVTWHGFSDIETDVPVLLGSYPGAEDIAPFVSVSQRTTWSFEHLDIPSGTNCIATVKAEDRVGHLTEAWSKAVVIDNTPPRVGLVAAGTITQDKFVPGKEIPVRWEGVEDIESGITTMEVAIVSEGELDLVTTFKRCHGNSALLTDASKMTDGHTYVALLKVTNGAGLVTLAQSEPFIVDSSPPDPGAVFNSAPNTSDHKSYSTEVGVYRVYWTGFTDPHSGLDYYRVGLGSQPSQTDIEPFVYVGLLTTYTWKREFELGKKYYGILEACNKAGLCRVTSSSSIMFDTSPPIGGLVTVGFDGHHSRFLGHNSSVPVQWIGFSDPQTGIQDFSWCVGLAPERCDVIPLTQTLLSRASVKAGTTLPTATPLFVTVRAQNPLGMTTVGVSDSFVVDTSPPVTVNVPHFVSPFDGRATNSQWDRSVLRLLWNFTDPDSSVVSNTVNIRSQLTGRLVIDPITMTAETGVRTLFTDISFHYHLLVDGDRYWAAVTACNAAGLCTTHTSHMLLVDSTPPVVGSFESPLSWMKNNPTISENARYNVSVTWLGFSDAESGVERYYLTAGSVYNGDDLSNGLVITPHQNNTRHQRFSLQLDEIKSGEAIHLSVWAENGAGLKSPVFRMEFTALFDDLVGTKGSLVSVRYGCKAAYCTGECTCAAAGRVCQVNRTSCQDLQPNDVALQGTNIILQICPQSGPENFTTSSKCLEGSWRLSSDMPISKVSRFQVSFGLAGRSYEEGLVFGTESTAVWHDVGRNMAAVYCLPGKEELGSGFQYVMHVRVWLSRNRRVTFTSDPVTVDHTAPGLIRGGTVLDSTTSNCLRDVDYVTTEMLVTSCWGGVFREQDGKILQYKVWVGSAPQADDVRKPVNVGLNTTFQVPTSGLEQGVHYYVTVHTVNLVGMTTTAVSDGFTVDVTLPVPGVVFTSQSYTNRHAQPSTSTLPASWDGFQDRHSGVASFRVALYDAKNGTIPVVPFRDVGIANTFTFEGLTLQDKHRYQVVVKARDAAGLDSLPVRSAPILIDTTPPEGVACQEYQLLATETMVYTKTSSFLHDKYHTEFQLERSAKTELIKVTIFGDGLEPGADGYVSVEELKMPLYFKYTISGNATAEHVLNRPASDNKTLTVMVEGNPGAILSAKLYRCSEMTSSVNESVTIHQMSEFDVSVCARVHDKESEIRSMHVGVGTTPGGLQVQPLTRVGYSGHMVINVQVQHGMPLYATVIAENHAGRRSRFISHPITIDRTPPAITEVNVTLQYGNKDPINGTQVWADVTWTAVDEESDVSSCLCRLEGQSTHGATTKETSHVAPGKCQWLLRHPQHGARVSGTVSCVNGVQMLTTVTSDMAAILLRAPDVSKAVVMTISNVPLTSPFEVSGPTVRSPNSSLEFCWRGIDDPTIALYQYRFLHELSSLEEWSSVDSYKSSAVLEKGLHPLLAGNVTVQVRAVNTRQMTSDVVSHTVRLDNDKPELTGAGASVTLKNMELQLDWQGVFKVNHDVTFAVYAGTAKGYGDLVNHVVTKETSFKGQLNVETLSSVFLTIQAVYASGQSEVYQTELSL